MIKRRKQIHLTHFMVQSRPPPNRTTGICILVYRKKKKELLLCNLNTRELGGSINK